MSFILVSAVSAVPPPAETTTAISASARNPHASKKGVETFDSKKEAAERLAEKEKSLSEKGRV